jgi:hypothetical protein
MSNKRKELAVKLGIPDDDLDMFSISHHTPNACAAQSEPITVFTCGKPQDHKCNSDGPEMCGGENPDGTHWEAIATPENRARAAWGSVSCSVCGRSAMETSMWQDWA